MYPICVPVYCISFTMIFLLFEKGGGGGGGEKQDHTQEYETNHWSSLCYLMKISIVSMQYSHSINCSCIEGLDLLQLSQWIHFYGWNAMNISSGIHRWRSIVSCRFLTAWTIFVFLCEPLISTSELSQSIITTHSTSFKGSRSQLGTYIIRIYSRILYLI